MSLLKLDISKCVHTSNKFAICNKCVEVCPVDTIKIEESTVSFVPNDCVGCGGCDAVCPTAAYTIDNFNPINYIFKFLEDENTILTCNDENFPCIASLSSEELLSLVLMSPKQILLDIGPCSECAIAHKNLDIIQKRASDVNFILEAMLQDKSLEVEELNHDITKETETLSRRKLLSKDVLKTAVSIKQQFQNEVESSDESVRTHQATSKDIVKIKDKTLPDRRSLLLMAMKRTSVPEIFHTIDINEISFISQKDIDESSCTNCQMCYRICPTGALSSDNRSSFINFNPLSCVQCHSCHDVCEPDAITLRKTFSLESFFEHKIETLVRFDIRRCDECGNFFSYNGGETCCDRCRVEEEEAKELWGI